MPRSRGLIDLDRHHAARAQRMDMLGRIGKEERDEAQAHRLGLLEPAPRQTPAMLLAWLQPPVRLLFRVKPKGCGSSELPTPSEDQLTRRSGSPRQKKSK